MPHAGRNDVALLQRFHTLCQRIGVRGRHVPQTADKLVCGGHIWDKGCVVIATEALNLLTCLTCLLFLLRSPLTLLDLLVDLCRNFVNSIGLFYSSVAVRVTAVW